MQKITPNLWFNNNAQEAIDFYTSVFEGGKIRKTSYYSEAGQDVHGKEPGSVLTIDFELEGLRFTAINAGPEFRFTPAISFIINLPEAAMVDELWHKLIDGGMALMPLDKYPFSDRYGWLQDKYGLSWQLIFSACVPRRQIVPSLLFTGDVAGKAEDAIKFYESLFPDSSIGEIFRYGSDQEPDQEGTVMYADFKLAGQTFAAMDSAQAHDFSFTEAVSLLVTCEDQAEVDRFWKALSSTPAAEQCGWLKDQFGLSWQIIPRRLEELISDADSEKVYRVMSALMNMKKLDIAGLEAAYAG